MRPTVAVGFFLLVTMAHAQDMSPSPEVEKANGPLTSDAVALPMQEQFSPITPISDAPVTKDRDQSLLDKPQPVARLGQWIAGGDPIPAFPDNLVVTERKNDGRLMWQVVEIDSCVWCGKPMTWKQSLLRKNSVGQWLLRAALNITDIELTHHSPCFQAHTCVGNPILGQTRVQAYSVSAGINVFAWVGTSWLQKGNKRYHIAGYRHAWIVPAVGDAFSSLGIVSTLARWHK